MNYTGIILFGLGLLGILMHNLLKMDEINRKYDGNFNMSKYWSVERFSIIISICVVFIATIVRSEIKQLEYAGKWLGVGYVAIGYMAQSLFVTLMGRAKAITTGNAQKPAAPKDEEIQNQ
ncbi:MAG: hypothetical protein EKK63_09040 [Acinetobacter sp.]|uniref:hypothetical protein n=1 Tax=Acinetobacter sp. TaxID=472 RepID=UPI000FA4A0B6|nr:hypothetical protein [Acinetobacter sp.]RUP39773.1 MAG: hypothetical protein EKK63_09040 [Acinetobacter sp.]